MIPVATTSITLLTYTDDDWGGQTGTLSTAGTGDPVRAHLSAPSGSAAFSSGGSTSSTQYRLVADPCELAADMAVRDETTGSIYRVDWVLSRGAPIPHVVAGVSASTSTP